MSAPVTPAKVDRSNGAEPASSPVVRVACDLGNLKSPQVVFEAGVPENRAKHGRSTPLSGRGKLKKIREDLLEKLAAQRLITASPSRIFSKSMLSFDLHAGPLLDDEVPGENELFVKFLTDRRRSTGRGTLRELINKRIALQTGAQALAQRQAKIGPPPQQVPSEPALDPSRKPKRDTRPKPDAPIRKKKNELKAESLNTSRRVSDLEIPLAQDEYVTSQPAVSQTQIFNPDLLSQTQVLSRDQVGSPRARTPHSARENIPFMSTPLVAPTQEDVERYPLETVEEEEPRSESPPKPRRERNRFIDDEADESEDCLSGDEEDDDDSDLSDLIASSPESDNDASDHIALHQKWLMEQENQIPSAPRDESTKPRRRPRPVADPSRVLLNSKLAGKPKPIKVQLKKPVNPTVPEAAQPVAASKIKGPPRARKFPHRKSSVSSACSELDVRVGRQLLNHSRRSGLFDFIAPPDAAALRKIQNNSIVREEEAAKSAAGSRLMGTRRFAFGDP